MTIQPPAGDNAGPGAGNTPPAGSIGNQPDYKALYEQTQQELAALKAEDWFKRAVGGQQSYRQEQQKARQLETQIAEFKTRAETAATSLTAKESDLAKLLEETAKVGSD